MSSKSQELAQEIADELRKRCTVAWLTSLITLQQSFDANGDATIQISDATPATTEKVAFIRVKAQDNTLVKDVLGLAQTVYTPSVVQVATEAVATNGSFLTAQNLIDLLGTCLARGARTEWWQETNGTPPSVTTFNTAAKLLATYEPNLYFKQICSQ